MNHSTDGADGLDNWPDINQRTIWADAMVVAHDLTPSRAAILQRVVLRAGKDSQVCSESHSHIAAGLALDRRTVGRAFEELADLGILSIQKRHSRGSATCYSPALTGHSDVLTGHSDSLNGTSSLPRTTREQVEPKERKEDDIKSSDSSLSPVTVDDKSHLKTLGDNPPHLKTLGDNPPHLEAEGPTSEVMGFDEPPEHYDADFVTKALDRFKDVHTWDSVRAAHFQYRNHPREFLIDLARWVKKDHSKANSTAKAKAEAMNLADGARFEELAQDIKDRKAGMTAAQIEARKAGKAAA